MAELKKIMKNKIIKIAIADDHFLFRRGFITLIESAKTSEVKYICVVDAASGIELEEKLSLADEQERPDVILLDLNMPGQNGFQTIAKILRSFPESKIIILTMQDDDQSIIRSLKMGARGYLTKDAQTAEVKNAIHSILEKGYYYPEDLAVRLVQNLSINPDLTETSAESIKLNEREREFLQLVCSELTYSEIAERMALSARTIDGYRDSLFSKLRVTTRVGLVLWAIRNNLINVKAS